MLNQSTFFELFQYYQRLLLPGRDRRKTPAANTETVRAFRDAYFPALLGADRILLTQSECTDASFCLPQPEHTDVVFLLPPPERTGMGFLLPQPERTGVGFRLLCK